MAVLSQTQNEPAQLTDAAAGGLEAAAARAAESAPATPVEEAEETGPLRRCAVTRERLAKERMIRFVIGPERMLVPDLQARLPGRGMWLSARRDVIEAAITRKAFSRALRAEVVVPADVPGIVELALKRRVIELLGLARRAGQAVAGFTKAREWLAAGRAVLIVQAADGSADERARMLSGRAVPVIAPVAAEELGQIFGRDHAVHVAVSAGRLAEMLRTESERLDGFIKGPGRADQPGG